MKKFLYKHLKGQADVALVLGTVVGLIAVSMTVIMGLMLFENVKGSINRASWSTEANESYDTLIANTGTGYDLITIAPILMAAGVVISLLLGFAFIARSIR